MRGRLEYGTGLDSSTRNEMAELKGMSAARRVVWGQGECRSPLVALVFSLKVKQSSQEGEGGKDTLEGCSLLDLAQATQSCQLAQEKT